MIFWDGVREEGETEAGVLLQGGDEWGRFVTRGAEGGVSLFVFLSVMFLGLAGNVSLSCPGIKQKVRRGMIDGKDT